MRKVIFTIVLCCCVFSSMAQTYKVVSFSGGECKVNNGNGWEVLGVSTRLDENSILWNTEYPSSEVILREEGQQRTFRVYMLNEQFALRRFVTDEAKGRPSGNLAKFSGYIVDIMQATKTVKVNVNHGRTMVTHRDASDGAISPADEFVRCVAAKFGGQMDVEGMTTLSSGLMVDLSYDGQTIALSNYSDEDVCVYLNVLTRRYASYTVAAMFEDEIITLSAMSETSVPFTGPMDKIILLASKVDHRYDPAVIAEVLEMSIGRQSPAPESEVPFCINIF